MRTPKALDARSGTADLDAANRILALVDLASRSTAMIALEGLGGRHSGASLGAIV